MRLLRTLLGLALLVLSTSIGLVSCSDDEPDAVQAEKNQSDDSTPATSYPLPFGLEEVDGSVAIGRPAAYENDEGEFVLKAAYRVGGDDPAAAFQSWLDQLEGAEDLRLGQVGVGRGEDGSVWLSAGGEGRDYVNLELWTTEAEPVLIVDIIRRPGDDAAPTSADAFEAGEQPDSSLEWTARKQGDVLFTEQGSTIHLPVGATAEMPTVPISGGTGGSYTVLTAEDGKAAVQAMIDEAEATTSDATIDQPEQLEHEGAVIVRASFVIMAGGWGFDVVSIQAPDEPAATLYVSSYAD